MYIRSPKRGRTLEEGLVDKFLLLYLINNVEEGIGDTKIQKLAFLSEFNMNLQGRKGFNYNFIKMPYGPFSPDLDKDIKDLEKCDLITGYAHTITPKGIQILKIFHHLIENNQHIIDKIRDINRKYSRIPRNELVDYVHNLPNPVYPSITIDKSRHGSYLLKRIRLAFARRAFKIDESDIASLEIFFDPQTLGSVINSLKEANTKPSVKLSDVLEIV